jgi:hypothetical protein
MITDVLISNSVFFNMMHVDAKDATNRRVRYIGGAWQ